MQLELNDKERELLKELLSLDMRSLGFEGPGEADALKEVLKRLDVPSVSPMAKSLMDMIDDARKRFGDYTFGDKGPHEVMNTDQIKRDLLGLPTIAAIGAVLVEVLENYKEPYYANRFVDAMINDFDSLPEVKFMELLDYDSRFEY